MWTVQIEGPLHGRSKRK